MRWSLSVAGVFGCLAPAQAIAQSSAGLPTAEAGKPVERPALSGGRSVDVFAVKGAVGSRLTAEVSGHGAFTATLYTPEGLAMLSERGENGVKLTAFLPFDATYRLSILREDSTRPFRLALASEAAPDIMTASWRYTVGYETDNPGTKTRVWLCWVEPGVTVRAYGVQPEITTTDLGGGVSRTDYIEKGKPKSIVMRRRIEGGEVVFQEDGSRRTYRGKLFRPLVNPAFRGYFCQPPPALAAAPLTPVTPAPAVSQAAKAAPAPAPQPSKRSPPRPPFAPPVFVK